MSPSLDDLVATWLAWDQDPVTRNEIIQLRDASNTTELEKRLRKRIAFGTAGLRGRMAAGFSCMNGLTVIQASQGLARYVLEHVPDAAERGVVIGHDTRHNSSRFAELAANAFRAAGVKIWWFGDYVPTPLVSFGCRHLQAAAGVMVTASHNPAQDNGYKVYWSNACQINTPVDVGIAESIQSNLEPWAGAWDTFDPTSEVDRLEEIQNAYTSAVSKFVASKSLGTTPTNAFAYTPMHGVGHKFFSPIMDALNVTGFFPVKEQVKPDPDFPTVAFPNPEEAGALDLAMKTADENGVKLVLATDPDADRLAAAERLSDSWWKFTGDQVGVLLASFVLENIVAPENKSRTYLLNSAVSTSMLEKMARIEGVHWQETLTGFKWLGNVAKRLQDEGYSVPYAFEEALGYLFSDVSFDKDGLTAAAVFLAAESTWRKQGLTPYSKLQQLYEKYGYFESINTYFTNPDPALTEEAFDRIRAKVAEHARLGDFQILRTRDLTHGRDTGTSDNASVLPADPGSQMLTFWLDNDVRFTIRGSGTEPKVKVYLECCGASQSSAQALAQKAFLSLVKEWVVPFAPTFKHAGEAISSSGVSVKLAI